MPRPSDVPEDVWQAAGEAYAGFNGNIPHNTERLARAILAERRRKTVLVALNDAGEERAMMGFAEPWPMDEFVEIITGWATVPGRRISARAADQSTGNADGSAGRSHSRFALSTESPASVPVDNFPRIKHMGEVK